MLPTGRDVYKRQDKDYPLTAAMKQQVRELTLIIKPTGDAAGRITAVSYTHLDVYKRQSWNSPAKWTPSSGERKRK